MHTLHVFHSDTINTLPHQLVSKTPQLERLYIYDLDWTGSPVHNTFFAMLSKFRSIHWLKLIRCKFRTFRQAWSLISALPCLRLLRIEGGCSLQEMSSPRWLNLPKSHLRDLQLTELFIEWSDHTPMPPTSRMLGIPLLAYLSRTPATTSLRRVQLVSCSRGISEPLWIRLRESLKALGSTLEDLSIESGK